MVANPLTHLELEAFERKALVSIPAWETDLLMRLDDAVIEALAEKSKPKADKAPVTTNEVPISDQKSLRSMLSGIASRVARKKGKSA